jgi:hypothetical protein
MQITIRYPEDCTEYEAVLYAEGCFDKHQHDYQRKEPTGKKDASVMVFLNDRTALFYRTKTGYFLEIQEQKS